jgi:hypothetical protein
VWVLKLRRRKVAGRERDKVAVKGRYQVAVKEQDQAAECAWAAVE